MELLQSVSCLPQRERRKPEELAARDSPERLEHRRERGRARGEAADDHAATGERPHASDCARSEEHTSELQSRVDLVCRLLLEKKKSKKRTHAQAHTTSQTARN